MDDSEVPDKLSRVHEWRENLLSHAEAYSSSFSTSKGIEGLFGVLTKIDRNDRDSNLRVMRDLISAIILSGKSSAERAYLLKKCYDMTKEMHRNVPDSNPFASLLWEPLESVGTPALAYEIRRLSMESPRVHSHKSHDKLAADSEKEKHRRDPVRSSEEGDNPSGLHVLRFLVANWEGNLISLPGFGRGDLTKTIRRACLCLRELDSGNAIFQQVRLLLIRSHNKYFRPSYDIDYSIWVLPNILEDRCVSHSKRKAILASDCIGFTAFINIPHMHVALSHLLPQTTRLHQSHSPSTSSPSSPFSTSPIVADFVSIDMLAVRCAWTLEIGRNSLRLMLVDSDGSTSYDGLIVDATVEILHAKDEANENHPHPHNFVFSLPKSKLHFPSHPRNGNSSTLLSPCFSHESSPTLAPRNAQEAVTDLQAPYDINGFDDKRLCSNNSGVLQLKLVVKFDKPLAYPMDAHTSLLLEPTINDPQLPFQRSVRSQSEALELSDASLSDSHSRSASLPVVNVIRPETRPNNEPYMESSISISDNRFRSLPKPPIIAGGPTGNGKDLKLDQQKPLFQRGTLEGQPIAMRRPLPRPPSLIIDTVNLTPAVLSSRPVTALSQPLDPSRVMLGDSPHTVTISNGSDTATPNYSEAFPRVLIDESQSDLISHSSPPLIDHDHNILPIQSAHYQASPHSLTSIGNHEEQSGSSIAKRENGASSWRKGMIAIIESSFSAHLPTDRNSDWSDDVVIYPLTINYLSQYLHWHGCITNSTSGGDLTVRSFLLKAHSLSTGNIMEVIGRQGKIREFLAATYRLSRSSTDERLNRVWKSVLRQALQFDEQDLALTLSSTLNTQNNRSLDEAVAMRKQDLISLMSVIQALIDRQYGSHRVLGRFLHKLVERTGTLPDYLFLSNIERIGDNPVAGGGFADVWKGKNSKRIVALKVLRIFDLAKPNEHQHQEFCKEAMIWRQFRHQNILPFYGVCISEFSPRLALVSPWMENGDITTYVKSNYNANRIGLVAGIALGLLYLHDLKPTVVHGDLRAANVLVDAYGHPKLADFGLSKIVDSQASTVTASPFSGKGAMRWQAPELLDTSRFGSESCGISTYSDTYVFASVCLEVFTMEVPFSHLRDGQVLLEVVIHDRRPLRPVADSVAAQSGLTDDIWALMERCWSTHPMARPGMREVVEALTESCP